MSSQASSSAPPPAPTPVLARLRHPVVQAPLAGGPSTPRLAAAVTDAGGLGFLAAGYLPAERIAEQIDAVRELTSGDVGVNLFVPGPDGADPAAVRRYADRLAPLAERAGVALGEPRHDDDAYAEKLAIVIERRVPVVSFTFGAPGREVVEALHGAGSEVWTTITSVREARQAAEAGSDALVVQGVEAGGHRGGFVDDDTQPNLSLLAALQLVRAAVDRPLIASGSLMTGSALAAVLAAGASAGQFGTAFLRAAEAGTSRPHRDAVGGPVDTVLTRAFSGRLARGIRNRWHDDLGADAPRAYPEVHHLTTPLRGHGREVNDPDLVNLWAGQAHALARTEPAEAIVRRLVSEARAAIATLPPL